MRQAASQGADTRDCTLTLTVHGTPLPPDLPRRLLHDIPCFDLYPNNRNNTPTLYHTI